MFRCENICKGPETVGNRRSMYHNCAHHTHSGKTPTDVPCRQYVTMKTALWLYCFTCVKRQFHTGDNGYSPEWQGLFIWVMVQMVHSSCTDTAVNIPGLRIQYDNRHLTSWLLQGKTKKTLCGDTENSVTSCRCISVWYGGETKTLQCGNKK